MTQLHISEYKVFTIKEQLNFLTKFREECLQYLDGNIIIGGDFNAILNPKLDKRGGRSDTRTDYVNNLTNFIEEFDLIDIWRVLNPDLFMFTWRSINPPVQCRLDYFLIPSFLSQSVKKCEIKPSFKTGHSILHITLEGFFCKQREKVFGNLIMNYCMTKNM